MIYRRLLIGVLAALAVSCSVEEIKTPVQDSHDAPVFYVSIDESQSGGADTKVFADESLHIKWNADDRFTIFNKKTYNREFCFKGKDGDTSGTIEAVGSDGPGETLDRIYAVYPYSESTDINTSGTITYTLPEEQSYRADSFGIDANVMVSATDDNRLRFKNAGGYLSLKFYGEGISISSITLKGNNGELLAGECTIDMSGGVPELTMDKSKATDAVTLVCDPAVTLGSSSSEAVACWFVLPPVTFTKGITITVTTSDGGVFEQSTSKNIVITRSSITRFAALEVKIPTKYVKVPVVIEGGTYLIAAVSDDKVFKGLADGSSAAVSPVDNVITDDTKSLSAYEFTLENNGSDYYLRYSDGKYLVCDYSSNGNSTSGVRYVGTKEEIKYPYKLTEANGAFFFNTTRADKNEPNQYLYYKTEGTNSNIFKIGGSGSSIGVHLYLKLGTGDSPLKKPQTLGFAAENVTWTLGDEYVVGESYDFPQLVEGAQTTVSYSSEPEDVAVIEDGRIRIVGTGSATIKASAEGTDDYYPASASYVLLIRRGPSEEWVDMGSFCLENDALRAYLDDAISSYSDTDDATNTVMETYATGSDYSHIDRKDCPNPVRITLADAASSSTVITIYENDTLASPIWSQNATLGATYADVYNLIPGRTYYYTVSEGSVVWERGYFKTTGRRRMIKVSDVEKKGHANNCRDLGGLEVMDKGTKKTIRYGYLFRGTNMDATTKDEKDLLTGFLNIGMDIDLRGNSSYSNVSGDNGSQNSYQPFTSPYEVGYVHPGFSNFGDLTTVGKVRDIVNAFIETATKNKATYFHCYIGADRTGYIGMLIEGLLGVSEKDCSIDYELTSFSEAAEQRYRTGRPNDYYFRQGIDFLRGQSGSTFQEKIENYLVKTVGIKEADIERFKSIVLK